MKVLVTGGTGFVGSHVSRQLLAKGHSVRLLVRSVEKASAIYQKYEAELPELVAGNVTDRACVDEAVAGCAAVVHAAAATPMQIESVEQMFAVNRDGTKNVVDAALNSGIDRIIYLSSITAIFDEDGAKVTADAPLHDSSMPYGQSKVQAEAYLRSRQDNGAPISILYPGGIIGPDDPGFSDSCRAIKHRVEQGFRIFGDGGMQYIDVRDLAAFVCALVQDGGQGRFLLPGVYSQWHEQADIIEQVSGASLNRIPAQGWKLRLVGRAMDVARRFKTIDSPVTAETMRYATLWPRIENSAELARRGLPLRDLRESFDDTLRWMVAAGHLQAELCPAYKV